MRLPWEEPTFNASMISDVETARLALTWALGRVRELEIVKARLEAAESSLLRAQRETVAGAKDCGHAEELKTERALREDLERRLADSVRHQAAAVAEVDAAAETERLRSEIDRLSRELEKSWIIAEMHRSELEDSKNKPGLKR